MIGRNNGMPMSDTMVELMYKKPTLEEDMQAEEQMNEMLESMTPVNVDDDAMNNRVNGESKGTVKDLNLDKMSG